MKIRSVVILVLVVALIAVVATMQFSQRKIEIANTGNIGSLNTDKPKKPDKTDVNFKVADDEGSLEMTSPDCGSKKGCFKVGRGKSGLIKFKFSDSFGGWQLTEFKICKIEPVNSLDCNLGVWERLDFFVSDDISGSNIFTTNSQGAIDLKTLAKSNEDETEFYLLNQNAIKKKYYYTIKACKTGVSKVCITTDPDIENKGRN